MTSDGSVNTSTTTTSNTVQVYGEGFSTSLQDETITLTWTPSGGNPLTSTSSFTVDSPYKLTLFSMTGPDAVDSCAPVFASGNSGWHTKYTWQMFSRFNNGLFGMSVNENFANYLRKSDRAE